MSPLMHAGRRLISSLPWLVRRRPNQGNRQARPMAAQPDPGLAVSNGTGQDDPSATRSSASPSDPASAATVVADPNTSYSPPGQSVSDGLHTPSARQAGRYQLHEEIARGGMGAILRASDPILGRELAVKVVLDGLPDDGRRRFLEEARVTARLQHPGVPSVHDLGELPDGRPFLVMRLIEGRTLADLLRDRASPKEDWPRFLGIFRQIAQTMAYAHSQQILHRDLKPANIMVGAFGEVQVMDWGLAKSPGACVAPSSGSSVVGSATSETVDWMPSALGQATQAGSVLGTLAYMAPEQARGQIDQLDERCDVFGLGAILCEILTGAPPYTGQDGAAIWRKARDVDLADAYQRLESCGCDAELLRLSKRCLAPQAEDRPKNAGMLADEVTAYLESAEKRLRQAELATAAARAVAVEERKRHRLRLALAASALFTVVVGSGLWIWAQQRQAKQQAKVARLDGERRQAVTAALDKAVDLTGQARYREAELFLRQVAEQMGADGPEDLQTRLEESRREARLLADLDYAQMHSSEIPNASENQAMTARQAYDRAFAAFGVDLLREPTEAVHRLRALRPGPRTAVILAVDGRTQFAKDEAERSRLRQLADELDDDSWRARWRRAESRAELEALVPDALKANLSATNLARVALRLAHSRAVAAAEQVSRAGVARYPADFWTHWIRAADVISTRKPLSSDDRAEQIGHLRAALALRPEAFAVHNNLGNALRAQGNIDEAIVCFRQALALNPLAKHPAFSLARALQSQRDWPAAMEAYHKAVELDPTNLALLRSWAVGSELARNWSESATAYTKLAELQPNEARPLVFLGFALVQSGRFQEAKTAYLRAAERASRANNPQAKDHERKAQLCDRLLWLEPRLSDLLSGKLKPRDMDDRIALSRLCRIKGQHAMAARLFADAFAAEPKLADDLEAADRYYAACSASLAADDRGPMTTLDAAVQARWRRQALDWLNADLVLRRKQAATGAASARQTVANKLRIWQNDPDLASLREPARIALLPAEEQTACKKLWQQVKELAAQASEAD